MTQAGMKQLAKAMPSAARAQESGQDNDRRDLTARWTITALLTILSAARIGSQETDYCDQTFERDEDGHPVLYGTTLAGALRSCLRDRMEGYRSADETSASRLTFGTMEGENSHESRVVVFDSHTSSRAPTALRDGVHLEPATRLAADHHKYDGEITLPGIEFPLRFDLILAAGEPEQQLLEWLVLALGDLTTAEAGTSVSVGAKRTRGLGLCQATRFRAERYDLTTDVGWRAYENSGYDAESLEYLPLLRQHDQPQKAIQMVCPSALPMLDIDRYTDQRQHLLLDFDLDLKSTLLIRSPGSGTDAPDDVHLMESGRDLLSGTAFIGALRHQVLRVLNTSPYLSALPTSVRQHMLEDLFGPDPNSASDPSASRVTLAGEPVLIGARRFQQTRTAIDRHSSVAVATALFEEEPCVGGHLRFKICIHQPSWQNTQSDAPLLLLGSRDLLENLFTLGGEASVGRGLVGGSVTATLKLPAEPEQVFYITSSGGVAETDIDRLESLLLPLEECCVKHIFTLVFFFALKGLVLPLKECFAEQEALLLKEGAVL